MRVGIILCGSLFIPRTRLTVVLCHTLAFGVEDTEVVLRVGIILCGSLFIPRTRLRVVLRDTLALVVEDTQIILRSSIARLSEGLPFFQRGDVVLLFVSLQGGGPQGFFLAVAQGMGGACGEEEGQAEGFHGCFPVSWEISCKACCAAFRANLSNVWAAAFSNHSRALALSSGTPSPL